MDVGCRAELMRPLVAANPLPLKNVHPDFVERIRPRPLGLTGNIVYFSSAETFGSMPLAGVLCRGQEAGYQAKREQAGPTSRSYNPWCSTVG